MRTCCLAALVATSAVAGEGVGFRMTSGWLTVLDVSEVQSVTSADGTIVSVISTGDDQVLLLGVTPGETLITVVEGPARSPRQTEYVVTVTRFPTVQPWNRLLTVDLDHPATLSAPKLERVAVGDASICGAVINGTQELALTPRRPGTTSLIVWVGGHRAAHRRQVLVTVEAGGVVRTVDDFAAVLTDPLDGRLTLVAGEHLLLEVPALARFAVVDSTVASVRIRRDGEVVVQGLAAGATSVLLWTGAARPVSRFVVVHARESWDQNPEPLDPTLEPVPVREAL